MHTPTTPIQPGKLFSYTIHENSFFSTPFRIMTWNIQRGFHYEGVIEYIKNIKPDVIFLQEVDWGNGRTAFKNIADEIAHAVDMNYIYAAKSKEIPKWTRAFSPKEGQGGGVIGNAILSRYTLTSPYVVRLPLVHTYQGIIPSRSAFRDWIAPKEGIPLALSTTIQNEKGEKIQLYCLHLDIFRTGIRSRVAQFHEVYIDAKDKPHALICGDFNTAAHGAFGMANFLENWDAFYLKNIFTPEAVYWKSTVLKDTEFTDPFDAKKDWTLKVGNIYHAKLDWTLGKGINFIHPFRGNDHSSDHFPLITDVLLNKQ